MTIEPSTLVVTGVLSAVASSYLATASDVVVDQRYRAEWASWGLLALASYLLLRRRRSTNHERQDGLIDKESQSDSQTPRREVKLSWLIALLLVAAQLTMLHIGKARSQWTFVSPIALP
jgi:hypothetical protein